MGTESAKFIERLQDCAFDRISGVKSAFPPSAYKTPTRSRPRSGKAARKDAEMVRQRAFNRALERVDFAVIDQRQQSMSKALVMDLSGAVARAVSRMLGTDENLAKLTDTDVEDIAAVEMSGVEKGRLKQLCSRALNSSWNMGQQMASAELAKVGARRGARVAMTDLRDTAAQFFEANGFRMAGNLSDAVRSVIQQELQNSVKFGRSPAQTREAIWLRLTSKGFLNREAVRTVETAANVVRALDLLQSDSEEDAAAYLDTLARTNLFEAMNEARYAEYTDPELSDFILALRYSAILDDRTTEVCSAMHDRVYKVGSPVWDDLRPPNHYNCRSVLIPVTRVDLDDGSWDGAESRRPTVKPQVGFGKEA